jgi:hypothetical protein
MSGIHSFVSDICGVECVEAVGPHFCRNCEERLAKVSCSCLIEMCCELLKVQVINSCSGLKV